MTDAQRNKRALIALAAVVVVLGGYLLLTRDTGSSNATARRETIPLAEHRLQRLRVAAASLPAKERNWKLVSDHLAASEKLLVAAADKELAQEKLLEIVRNVAKTQREPLPIRSQELLPPKRRGDYGEVLIAFNLDCRIEQLVNFMSDISALPEAVSTEQVQVRGMAPETKVMQVRIEVAALVPAKLVPQKREVPEF